MIVCDVNHKWLAFEYFWLLCYSWTMFFILLVVTSMYSFCHSLYDVHVHNPSQYPVSNFQHNPTVVSIHIRSSPPTHQPITTTPDTYN